MRDRRYTYIRFLAAGLTVVLFAIIWLYTREFPVLSNTIGVRWLLIGAGMAGALAGGSMLYALRHRLTPWEQHLPELFTILIFSVLFAPLFISLANRAGCKTEYQPFLFESELPYFSSNYGLLKGEKIKPTGYSLRVKEGNKLYRFLYKRQPYYPLTQPGDTVLLPVCHGWLGFRVMELR